MKRTLKMGKCTADVYEISPPPSIKLILKDDTRCSSYINESKTCVWIKRNLRDA